MTEDELKADADEAIAEQTPMVGTITLRPTANGYRVNMTKSQRRAVDTAFVVMGNIGMHATDDTKEPAQRAEQAIAEVTNAYDDETE